MHILVLLPSAGRSVYAVSEVILKRKKISILSVDTGRWTIHLSVLVSRDV